MRNTADRTRLLSVEASTKALRDLVGYWHNAARDPGQGRLLAYALLGAPWRSKDDDHFLAVALEDRLADELAQSYHKAGLPAPDDEASPGERLKAVQQHQTLFVLELLWAYGAGGVTTTQLAGICRVTPRRIQQQINDGCAILAQRLLLDQQAPVAEQQGPHGAATVDGDHEPTTAPTDQHRASAAEPTSGPSQRIAIQMRTSSSPHVRSNSGLVVGEQHAHSIHIYTGPPAEPQRQSDTTERLLAVLTLLIAALLILRWPHATLIIIGGLAFWRAAAALLRLRREWTYRTTEERAWFECFAGTWLLISAASFVIYTDLAASDVFPLLRDDGLFLLLAYLAVATGLVLISILDFTLLIQRRDPARWPWDTLSHYAIGPWIGRWYLLSGSAITAAAALAIQHLTP